MLSNAYFLAKFRFDTAENEPAKNLQNFRKMHFRKMHFRKMQATHLAGGAGHDAGAGALEELRELPRARRRGGLRHVALAGPRASSVVTSSTSESVDWQNFGKMLLVFGCIGSDFCNKICVLQHFSKSTRFSNRNF